MFKILFDTRDRRYCWTRDFDLSGEQTLDEIKKKVEEHLKEFKKEFGIVEIKKQGAYPERYDCGVLLEEYRKPEKKQLTYEIRLDSEFFEATLKRLNDKVDELKVKLEGLATKI